jgi:protein-disulfide isomerase
MMKRLTLLVASSLVIASTATAQATPETDAVRRFAKAYLTYVPGSTYEVRLDHNGTTPNGTYQAFTVVRSGPAPDKFNEQLGIVLDNRTRMLTAGMVAPVPATNPPVNASNLPYFVDNVLPQVVKQMFPTSVRVRWPGVPARPTAIVPLTLDVGTGYGWAHMPLAITADGRYLMLGGIWNLDRDPRAQRREAIDATLVQWDPGHDAAPVKVVEFSDYECPACKRAWGELKPIFAGFGESVRHGMVNFPLTNSHPWAFRAASAGSCVFSAWPEKLLAFKDEMYRLQDTMTVATVDEAAFGFLDQHSLDRAKFLACHMNDAKGQVMDRILLQMDLGHRLGVFGTPAYYVNGEQFPGGKPDVARKRLQAIIDAGGKPEDAADVEPEPATPAAAAKPAAAPQPK